MLKLSEAYAFGDISRQALQAVFNQIFPGKSRVLFPHWASNAVGISKQETNWYFYNDPLLVNEDKFAFIEIASVPSMDLGLLYKGLPQQEWSSQELHLYYLRNG